MKKLIKVLLMVIAVVFLFLGWSYHNGSGEPGQPDGKIKALLSNISYSDTEFYSKENSSYESFCVSKSIAPLISDLRETSRKTAKCFNDNDSWVVASRLRNAKTDYWCVDSINKTMSITKERYDQIINANTLCL